MSKQQCEECRGTGWYGDNGPGILGNREFHRCDSCDGSRVKKCSNGHHRYEFVGEVPWCKECDQEADLSVCRIYHPAHDTPFGGFAMNPDPLPGNTGLGGFALQISTSKDT